MRTAKVLFKPGQKENLPLLQNRTLCVPPSPSPDVTAIVATRSDKVRSELLERWANYERLLSEERHSRIEVVSGSTLWCYTNLMRILIKLNLMALKSKDFKISWKILCDIFWNYLLFFFSESYFSPLFLETLRAVLHYKLFYTFRRISQSFVNN